MRILHLIQRYHPARGGAETLLAEISNHLADQGHAVTVLTSDALDFELFWDPNRRRVAEPAGTVKGVRVLRFPVRHLPAAPLAYPGIRRLLWALSLSRVAPVALLHRLARYTPWTPDLWRWLADTGEPFDLAAGMTICFEPFIEAGLRFAQRRGIPFVNYPLTHLGAGPQPAQDSLSRFYTMRHQVDLVRRSDGVIVQTEAERDFYIRRGLPPARVVTAGPGIYPDEVWGGDGRRFRQQHQIQGPIVLGLGTMSADKGTPTTVQAVRRLWQAGVEVELVLIGAVLAPFQRFLDRLPAADRARIHLLGPVDDATKRDALAACAMMAMPSRTESFGIVYLEAWLYGKPVIGARTWGVNTLILDGENGRLVPFGDAAALAEVIQDLLAHPEKGATWGAHGRALTLRKHTWEHKVSISEKLYTSLIRSH